MTSLVESLVCECTPGKVYVNNASLRQHYKTNRHMEYTKRNEEKQLRIRLAELERDNAKLSRDNSMLSKYLCYPNRRQVTNRMKKNVAARAKWRCEMCKKIVNANYEIDHIIPLYKAGDNSINNLQCLCPDCHRTKTADDMLIE